MNWSALILWLAVLPFAALAVTAAVEMRPANRALRRRLRDLSSTTAPLGLPMSAAEPGALAGIDADLVARLCSLAVASSMAPAPRVHRWRRRIGAVVGAAGVFGWAGAAAAGASVGLVSTGNLPAPVQRVVADVLEVVNVEVPRPARRRTRDILGVKAFSRHARRLRLPCDRHMTRQKRPGELSVISRGQQHRLRRVVARRR